MKIGRLLCALTIGLGLTLAALAGFGGDLPRVRAATYTVTNTNAGGPGSLYQAILDANANPGHDTIDFGVTGAIVLKDALPAIIDDLTIAGPGAEQLAVSGANAYRVFAINSGVAVTITGVTVRDGNATYGGGVYVDEGSATLSEMQIVSNSAKSGGGVFVWNGNATLNGVQVFSNSASSYGGGGVYAYQGNVTLSETQMLSNSAAYYGGGAYVDRGSATLGVSGGAIDSNAAGAGGGVYVHQGSATLNGTQVIRNSSIYSGGGMYVGQGNATLSETQVLSNASGAGGGVYIDDGSARLSASGGAIVSNSVITSGGGIYVSSGSATLSKTQVVSNSADISGGGVFVDEGSTTLNRTQVISNSANNGGGVSIRAGNATLNVNGGEIVSNSAAYHGGGVYILGGSATLTETQVLSNSASSGGGMYIYYSNATLRMNGGMIDNNLADNGGGIYVVYGSAILNGARVFSNTASEDGGGMYIGLGSATLSSTQVISNVAVVGGGVYVDQGDATLNVNKGTIASNTAGFGGGVCISYGSAILSDTQVISNSASQYGGGVEVYEDSATLRASGGVIANNSADEGGGVYISQGSATLSGTQVIRNSAVISGGGVYVDEGEAMLNSVHVLDNTAGNGGSLYQSAGNITATNGCIVNNADTSAVRADGPTLGATGNWWGAADGPSGVGPGSGDSVSAGVDYAGFLTAPLPGCPTLAPDLAIVKTVTPTVAGPGQAITYTLAFHNAGLHLASGVIITDTIPVSVTRSSLNVDSNVPITATGSISYVWETVDLAPGAGGVITITGVLSDSLTAGIFANTAAIASAAIDADVADNSSSVWLTLNQVPVANAGSDQSVDTNAIVTLDGSGSSDPDGDLPLAYGWTQTGGPSIILSDSADVSPTFTALSDPVALTFTLIVTDNLGLPAPIPDEVIVTINNRPPVADAGIDQRVATDTLVTLDGNGSNDPDGDYPLSYLWTQTGGPAVSLNNPTGAGPAFIAQSDPAVLTFTLAVTDSLGLPDPTPDEVVIIVGAENQSPAADAGPDQSVAISATVTLDGSGSSDPDGDYPLTYGWTQTGGPAVTFTSNLSITTFTAPSESAALTFTLAVTDSLGLPDPTPDEVVITIFQQLRHIYLPLVIRQ